MIQTPHRKAPYVNLSPLSTRGYETTQRIFNPLNVLDHPLEPKARSLKPATSCERRSLEKNRESLHTAREEAKHKAVQMLVKPLLNRAENLLSEHEMLLPQGKNAAAFCADVAAAVERAVFRICYKAAKLAAEYNNKIRSIYFNLGKNISLASEVLRGGIPPERLAQMTTDEMANKELQEYMAKVRIQSEINVTLVTTDGPRIRKTHKGEELVEPLQESSRSPRPEESLFQPAIEIHQPDDVQSGHMARSPGLINTHTMEVGTSQGGWTPVESNSSEGSNSPNSGHQQYMLSGLHREQEDSECYEDSGGSDKSTPCTSQDDMYLGHSQLGKSLSPPSTFGSPSRDQMTTTVMEGGRWVGRIEMRGIEGTCTIGELMGGPDSICGVNWSSLLDELLCVDSDVNPGITNSFLKDLCTSNSTSVMMVSLRPLGRADETEWTDVFNHFKDIGRHGVIAKHYLGCTRVMYLIFLETYDRVPAWFEFLDPPSRVATHGRQTRLMLLVSAFTQQQVADLISSRFGNRSSHTL